MTHSDQTPPATGIYRIIHIAATLGALAFVLTAEYATLTLAGLLCMFFALYVSGRCLYWFHNNRFSPQHLRVGFTWAIIGIDSETAEFDTGPVRMYFSLLVLLFAGLVLSLIHI